MAENEDEPVVNVEPEDQLSVPPESDEPELAETEPSDPAPSNKITIGALRRRASANADGTEADTARRIGESFAKSFDGRRAAERMVAASGIGDSVKRMQEQIAKSTGFARTAEEIASSFRSPAIDNLVRQQREMAEWREQQQEEIEDISNSLAEARRRQEDRADSQAEATIAIARAQERLQELQARGLELATAQAEATAQVAQAQQETLAAIREELEVLRDQHAVQQRLLHSGWSGGVVMEWTLLVAIIAAVASVVLGLVEAADIPSVAWWLAGFAIVFAGVSLGLWQRNRRPKGS